jgi:signal peptidase I
MTNEAPKPASLKRTLIIALIYPSLAFYYAGMSFFGAVRVAAVLALASISTLLTGHFMTWREAWTSTAVLATVIFIIAAWAAVVYAKRVGPRPPKTLWRYVQFCLASLAVSIPIAMLEDVPGFRAHKLLKETSASMAPTFVVGDRILVDLTVYKHVSPKAGDLVAFMREDWPYVKRVVGVPGDTVEVKDKVLLRNGQPFALPEGSGQQQESPFSHDTPETTVPEGTVYVVGDNLWNSIDSRVYGPIPLADVIGRAEAVLFQLSGTEIRPERINMDVR